MLRRLWRLWRDRHFIQGRHFQVDIEGHWWSPSARKDARAGAVLLDFALDEAQEDARKQCRHLMLHGGAYTRKHFAPDEWPFPDEDPPDPL